MEQYRVNFLEEVPLGNDPPSESQQLTEIIETN